MVVQAFYGVLKLELNPIGQKIGVISYLHNYFEPHNKALFLTTLLAMLIQGGTEQHELFKTSEVIANHH